MIFVSPRVWDSSLRSEHLEIRVTGKKSEVKFQRLVRINIMVCDQVSPLCIHSSIVISSTKVQKKATHTSSCVQIQNPNSPREFKKPDCNREIYYEA